jgi:hypothetical protein
MQVFDQQTLVRDCRPEGCDIPSIILYWWPLGVWLFCLALDFVTPFVDLKPPLPYYFPIVLIFLVVNVAGLTAYNRRAVNNGFCSVVSHLQFCRTKQNRIACRALQLIIDYDPHVPNLPLKYPAKRPIMANFHIML